MHRDGSREGWAWRNERCTLSAALVSKAAFIMRKHSQNRKQTASPAKPKNTPGSSGKESVCLKWVLRVGWERCVWSQRQCPMFKVHQQAAVSAPCLSHLYTPHALFLQHHLQLSCCSFPWRADPSRCTQWGWQRWRSAQALMVPGKTAGRLEIKTTRWGGVKHHCQNLIPRHLFFLQLSKNRSKISCFKYSAELFKSMTSFFFIAHSDEFCFLILFCCDCIVTDSIVLCHSYFHKLFLQRQQLFCVTAEFCQEKVGFFISCQCYC